VECACRGCARKTARAVELVYGAQRTSTPVAGEPSSRNPSTTRPCCNGIAVPSSGCHRSATGFIGGLTSAPQEPSAHAMTRGKMPRRAGVGMQVYLFSARRFQTPESKVGKVLGPLRIFAEYNRTHYWGNTNVWRPHRQTRAGFEYWSKVAWGLNFGSRRATLASRGDM
jgi:hypothetical protein